MCSLNMPKLVPIKPKKLIKILLKLGFSQRDAEGSHVFFKHPDGNTTVVSLHNQEISSGGLPGRAVDRIYIYLKLNI